MTFNTTIVTTGATTATFSCDAPTYGDGYPQSGEYFYQIHWYYPSEHPIVTGEGYVDPSSYDDFNQNSEYYHAVQGINELTITGLVPGQLYQYQVQLVNDYNPTGWIGSATVGDLSYTHLPFYFDDGTNVGKPVISGTTVTIFNVNFLETGITDDSNYGPNKIYLGTSLDINSASEFKYVGGTLTAYIDPSLDPTSDPPGDLTVDVKNLKIFYYQINPTAYCQCGLDFDILVPIVGTITATNTDGSAGTVELSSSDASGTLQFFEFGDDNEAIVGAPYTANELAISITASPGDHTYIARYYFGPESYSVNSFTGVTVTIPNPPSLGLDLTLTNTGSTVELDITNIKIDGVSNIDYNTLSLSLGQTYSQNINDGSAIFLEIPYTSSPITLTFRASSSTKTTGVYTIIKSIPGYHPSGNYNNMSGTVQDTPAPPSNPSLGGSTAMLSYDWLFTTQAGVTFTYDLHGEVSSNVPYDQSITIPVPVGDMSQLLAYQFAGAGANGVTLADGTTGIAPEPEVCLRLQSIVGPLLDQLSQAACDETTTAMFNVVNHVINAGGSPSTVHSLQERFRNITDFTYSAGAGHLNQIPQEAIAAVNYGGVTMAPLSGVVGCPCTATDGVTGVTGALDSQRDALQSLFEQAAAAGMIQTTEPAHVLTLGNTGNEADLTGDGLTAPIYGASFSVGQQLAFYVQYNLKKTRNYEVVGLANVAAVHQTGSTGATAHTVTYGGLEFTVPASQAETSDDYNVTWQIVLEAS